MQKLFFIAMVSFFLLISCTCEPQENYSYSSSSMIEKIGETGECRVLYLDNGRIIKTRSQADFNAFPDDSVEYVRGKYNRLTITVWFSKERQSLPPKQQEKEKSSQIIFYPLPN